MYSIVMDPEAYDRALALAKGCYQLALLQGTEALSGSTLKGKAKTYSGRYRASADSLVSAMRAAGIVCGEIRQTHGRRVLVIGGVLAD